MGRRGGSGVQVGDNDAMNNSLIITLKGFHKMFQYGEGVMAGFA